MEGIHSYSMSGFNPDKKLIINFFVNPEDKKFISNELFGLIKSVDRAVGQCDFTMKKKHILVYKE